MQKRTSPLKFGDLALKSVLNSVSNLSTKVLLDLDTVRYDRVEEDIPAGLPEPEQPPPGTEDATEAPADRPPRVPDAEDLLEDPAAPAGEPAAWDEPAERPPRVPAEEAAEEAAEVRRRMNEMTASNNEFFNFLHLFYSLNFAIWKPTIDEFFIGVSVQCRNF